MFLFKETFVCCCYSTLKFIESFKVISLFNYQSSFCLLLFRSSDSLFTISLLNSFVNNFFGKVFSDDYQGNSIPVCHLLSFSTRQLNYINISSFVCQQLLQLSKAYFLWLCESVSLSQSACLYYHPILRMSTAFLQFMTFEKSSNKCKTLLAKHHFIILHNSVCVLLANLHRLPLFSFCSLLFYAIYASFASSSWNSSLDVLHPNISLG